MAATVRASSLGELLDCAHRWEAKHLLGMRGPTSAEAHLGTSVHAATAAYDSRQATTVDEATAAFVDAFQHPQDEVSWQGLTPAKAASIGIGLTVDYCRDWANQSYVSIEHTLTPMDVDVHGFAITFTGTLDRCRIDVTSGVARIRDVKTGKRVLTVDEDDGRLIAATKGHAAQTGLYALLASRDPVLALPDVSPDTEIIALSTTKSTGGSIAMGVITDAVGQLIGDSEQPGLIEYAALYLRTGMFPPNPRSQLCSQKFCPRWDSCRFHS